MKNRFKLTLIAGLSMVSTFNLSAESLLGKNYVGASVGVVEIGNDQLDAIYGNIYGANLGVHLNIAPNVDMAFGGGVDYADGAIGGNDIELNAWGIGGDLIYFFEATQDIVPYASIGLTYIDQEIDTEGFGGELDFEEGELGYNAELGAQLSVNEWLLLHYSLDYFYIDSSGSVDVNTGISTWFSETVVGTLSLFYDLDDQDAGANYGVSFLF